MFPRRKKGFPFPFDDDFDRIFEDMEEMMKEMIEKIEKGEIKDNGPIVYGVSMRIGPDGKIIVDEFGNKPKEGEITGEREPLTDIINDKEEITVIAELPGVTKEDISVKVNDRDLIIKVNKAERKYFKKLRLPAPVDPKSAKAHYNNGILEVRFKKLNKKDENGIKIDIE